MGRAQAVLGRAREALALAEDTWGRTAMSDSSSGLERVVLDVGEANLECTLAGGFQSASESLYRRALDALEGNGTDRVAGLLKVHCLLGLARLSLSNDVSPSIATAEKLAREAIVILSSLEEQKEKSNYPVLLCMYAWSAPAVAFIPRLHLDAAGRGRLHAGPR